MIPGIHSNYRSRLVRSISGVVAFLLITGCATPLDEQSKWISHDRQELEGRWGRPNSIKDLGHGRQQWIYSGYSKVGHRWLPLCQFHFLIDRMGIIYGVEPNTCEPGTQPGFAVDKKIVAPDWFPPTGPGRLIQ